jgi:fluoroquinolone resistance protein
MARIEDQTFEQLDLASAPVRGNTYENCAFQNCIFTEADFSEVRFIDCSFENCDLSNVNLSETAFRGVTFKACKMLGLKFEHCNPFLFAVRFEDCQLNFSSFYQCGLQKTVFQDCSLHEVDFAGADLAAADFSESDLNGAVFDDTVLDKADLRTAKNYSIDPNQNSIKKARFRPEGLIGLLWQYDIEVEW